MNTFHQMWGVSTPSEATDKINSQRAEAIDRLDGREPVNLEEQALALVGRDIYETLIKEYTSTVFSPSMVSSGQDASPS